MRRRERRESRRTRLAIVISRQRRKVHRHLIAAVTLILLRVVEVMRGELVRPLVGCLEVVVGCGGRVERRRRGRTRRRSVGSVSETGRGSAKDTHVEKVRETERVRGGKDGGKECRGGREERAGTRKGRRRKEKRIRVEEKTTT